jgi:hypothetical protein
LEREAEEVEDWFRERNKQELPIRSGELERGEAAAREQRRRAWMQRWTQHALDSLPYGVPREAELDVHATVEQTLMRLQPEQPTALIQRLIGAAVEKALVPWRRRSGRQEAIEGAMNQFAGEVLYRPEFAALKGRAYQAISFAIDRCGEEATGAEMELAAGQAIQPMMQEYRHQQACQRILAALYVPQATSDESHHAKAVVQKALAAVAIGATPKQLDKARQTALAPLEARIAQRTEKTRIEEERHAARRDASWKVDNRLHHIERYLDSEYEFDGGTSELRSEAGRLRPLVREALIVELLEDPEMTSEEIDERIESLIDEDL